MASATQSQKAALKNSVASSSKNWKEVSKNNPCPICDKSDWCAISPDGNAVVCNRADTAPSGWKFIKPSSNDGWIYSKVTDRVKTSRRSKKVTRKPKDKIIPLPKDITLVELTTIPTDIPQPKKVREPKLGDVWETRYIYDDDKCILRRQWVDDTKEKGYSKEFRPCRKIVNPDGTTDFKWNKGDDPWGAYKINEAIGAINKTTGTPFVLFQEGEGCVEIARSLGIASTCVDGSSWTTNGLTFAIGPIGEAGAGVIYLADNDEPGNKKASQVEKVCNTLQVPCIVIKSSAICDIPNGGDIKEIMQQLDKDEFIERLLDEVHTAVDARSSTDDGDGGDWDDDDDDWDDDDGGKPQKETLPAHNAIASILKPHLTNLKYRDDYHQWMRYQNGYWTVASKESMFQMVTDAIEELYPTIGFSAGYPEGATKMLQARLLCTDWPEAPRHLLPFKNGVLDLNTGRMLPHNPKYHFENVIDRVHNPEDTDWSAINDWIDFCFEDNQDQKHLFLCWYAAVLRGMSDLHRFAMLIGEGGTGKSTAMQLATDLIGKRASHSLTLNALHNNTFQTGNIYDKRLVCVNDADRYHGDNGILKNITGGDEINVEWKGEKAFNAKYRGLVMVSANNEVFDQNDSGLLRRQLIFRFNRKVDRIDTKLGEKLSAQIGAFTNHLLTIPLDEIIYTLLYKHDPSGVAAQNELEALLRTNSVAEWMNSCLAYDPNGEIQIGCDKNNSSQLYGSYYTFCDKSGSKVRASKDFSPQIETIGKGVLHRVKTNSKNVIRGVRFSEDGGLLETLAKFQKAQTSNHPPHPPHPPQNSYNPYVASILEVESTLHAPSTNVEGSGESISHPPRTLHSNQNHTQQSIQPLNSSKVEGVEGKSDSSRREENNLVIGIDRQADYLGDVVTIVGFDSKTATVTVEYPGGKKRTVKRTQLKAVSTSPACDPTFNSQSPIPNDQQSLNINHR